MPKRACNTTLQQALAQHGLQPSDQREPMQDQPLTHTMSDTTGQPASGALPPLLPPPASDVQPPASSASQTYWPELPSLDENGDERY